MEEPLFSSNLFSHPNKILDEHLINVANLIEFFLRDKPEPIQKKLLPVAKIAGFTHDLGKATRSFQDYITSKSRENAKKLNIQSFLLFVLIIFVKHKQKMISYLFLLCFG
jgi:CRISPR-associated endonuclease Cas3-HD